MAKITPHVNNFLYLKKKQCKSFSVRRNFWYLIMVSTEVIKYVYIKSLFGKFLKEASIAFI